MAHYYFENKPQPTGKSGKKIASSLHHAYICRENEYASILEDVKGARITAWWDRAADIISATGSKGYGIEKVLDYYGLDKGQALAFGDGANDIEMLQTAGIGVAMGNAGDNVKASADDICGTAADDGIFTYCREHGLI